jgi:hypothetical protein
MLAFDAPPRTMHSNYPEPIKAMITGRVKRPLNDLKSIHLIVKSSFILMILFFLGSGYCERVSIKCFLRLEMQSRLGGMSGTVEELRIEIVHDDDKILISGESFGLDISIHNYHRGATRSIENRSDNNTWSIARIDEVGRGVIFKSINIDRRLGKLRYEESLSLDGKIANSSRAFGDCVGFDESPRRF